MESFKSVEYTRYWDSILGGNVEKKPDEFDWFVSVDSVYPF